MQTIMKPWGKEEILEINDRYLVKRLTMNKGNRCSLQYHNIKKETIYVLSGNLKISFGPTIDSLEENIYLPNDSITIAPLVIHRMEAVTDSIYLEASTPDMDDVVRINDDYQRAEP